MNGYRIYLIVFLLIGLVGVVSPTLAQEDSQLIANLTLEPTESTPIGTRPTIQAKLTNEDGRANPNKVLILYLDGEKVRQIRTDELGQASIRISQDLSIGEHQIDVVFSGTEAYRAASASQTLTIRPIPIPSPIRMN